MVVDDKGDAGTRQFHYLVDVFSFMFITRQLYIVCGSRMHDNNIKYTKGVVHTMLYMAMSIL